MLCFVSPSLQYLCSPNEDFGRQNKRSVVSLPVQHATTECAKWVDKSTWYPRCSKLQRHRFRSWMLPCTWERTLARNGNAGFGKSVLWLPNEDFGGRNKRWEPHFRGPLSGCEYSIRATNYWKINRKSAFHHLFIRPKSSFGDHKVPCGEQELRDFRPPT